MILNSSISELPADARIRLADPRVQNLKYCGPGMPNDRVVLPAEDPPSPGESAFLILSTVTPEGWGCFNVTWLNEVRAPLSSVGLAVLGTETPTFRAEGAMPAVPDAWFYLNVLIAAPKIVEIVQAHDPEISTVPIDWQFADGGKLDGYAFLDTQRYIAAYDYRRSSMRVDRDATRCFIAGMSSVRALRSDLPDSVTIFREAYWSYQIFVSRGLAAALNDVGARIDFCDPATMKPIYDCGM